MRASRNAASRATERSRTPLGGLLAPLVFAATACQAPSFSAEAAVPGGRTLVTSGVERVYRLHRPANAGRGKLPLVIALHGASHKIDGSGLAEFELESGFDVEADREGFLVAYPLSIVGVWRSVLSDDTKFLSDLVDALIAKENADPERVYLVGFSAGGGMAFRTACGALASRLAGVAIISSGGSAPAPYEAGGRPQCPAARPLPVILVHGGMDKTVATLATKKPCRANHEDGLKMHCQLADVELMDFWAHVNDPALGKTAAFPEPTVLGFLKTRSFTSANGGPPVELHTIDGAGHLFPSMNEQLHTSGQPPVATLVYRFLSRHRRSDFQPPEPAVVRRTGG